MSRILYWFARDVNVDVYVGCPVKKFNISKYITSSSRRRSAIQNSIIWYAAKSGEKAAMGWKWFLGWAPRWGSIEGGGEGTAVTDGMSRTDVDIIHYDWPTGFLYAFSSSNKRKRFFLNPLHLSIHRDIFSLIEYWIMLYWKIYEGL